MEKDNKYTLSCKNVKNIPFDKYEQNFTFIVNGQRYRTSRVKADLLSPVVSGYHFNDESIEEMIVNTKGGEEKETQAGIDYFSDFLKITDFSAKTIDEKHRKHYIEYFYALGNMDECLRLQREYFENLSPENVIDRLKFFDKLKAGNKENERMMKEIIKYASAHFEEINIEEMKMLEPEILEEIIKNPSLQLIDEYSLIEFILELCENDKKYSTLFEYVEFKNVKVDSLKKFIESVDNELLNSQIWKRIFQCLFSSETSKEATERYSKKYITREHEEGTEFNGLLRYLSDKTGGNIHDNGTIEVTSNSIYHHPNYLLDYQNTESGYFHSLDGKKKDVYICFDFKDRKIRLTSYTIKSLKNGPNSWHLKNWNIEVSNDKKHWIKIDEHINDPTLNGSKIVATFNIKKKTNFYQYVQLRQTGTNWHNDYYMIFHSLEMYGKLYEPSSI